MADKKDKKDAPSTEDDISGLFARFGATAAASGYQDFQVVRPVPETTKRAAAKDRVAARRDDVVAADVASEAQVTPPEPAPAPVAPLPLPLTTSVATGTVRKKPVPAAKGTPLKELFHRLLEAEPAVRAEAASPLKRIVGRH
ncbi:hypothetical protein [Stenotrophomonas sp. MMGLT7]|uniref:hypothetical protein n=1 Tax=Stenotrophomonas sp. MMGLT7 TaxID=2901227 RepID=UPI001E4C9ADA|nr:hypothetical protein [Stenotrophomonas sp. MMGLT7]MCD7099994.1 hypothetical protein [Stenotrophomonas sp. MMGLT7]